MEKFSLKYKKTVVRAVYEMDINKLYNFINYSKNNKKYFTSVTYPLGRNLTGFHIASGYILAPQAGRQDHGPLFFFFFFWENGLDRMGAKLSKH